MVARHHRVRQVVDVVLEVLAVGRKVQDSHCLKEASALVEDVVNRGLDVGEASVARLLSLSGLGLKPVFDAGARCVERKRTVVMLAWVIVSDDRLVVIRIVQAL